MKMVVLKCILTVAVFILLDFVPLQAATITQKYIVTDIGTLGGSESFAYAINDLGQIIGLSRMFGEREDHIFLYDKGRLSDISAIYNISSGYYAATANDINNKGEIVGNLSNGNSMLLSHAVITDLGAFGGFYSSALGINNLGEIVGYYASPYGIHHAFLYSNGNITRLGPFGDEAISVAVAINDSGMVAVGATDSYKGPYRVFLYSNGVMVDISPFGSSESYPGNINNLGQVVGEFLTSDRTAFHCFLYSGRETTDLGTLGGPGCVADAINERGDVVGASPVQVGTEIYCDHETGACFEYPVYSWHGFLYKDGKMTDLNSLIPSDYGWEINWAFDINNKGQIVGYGMINDVDWVYRAFLLTPVLDVTIDIKPRGYRNSINPKSKGKIPVAILSTEGFNAPSQVDRNSLTFGSTGEEPSLAFCNRNGKDVNGDGLKDLVCHFCTEFTKFQRDDTEGILKGKTVDGMPILGYDSVRINPRK